MKPSNNFQNRQCVGFNMPKGRQNYEQGLESFLSFGLEPCL